MVRIQQAQEQVQNARVPQAYIDGGNTAGAFGEQLAQAYMNAGHSLQEMTNAAIRYNDSVNRTKALELKNSFYTEWEEPKLYSKDGYYNQLGSNASGKSKDLITDFDTFARQKAKSLGLSGIGSSKYVEAIISDTKEKISRGVLAHDLKQTQEAEKTQASLLLQNLQTSAIENRNNEPELNKNLAEIDKAVYIFGKTSNMDENQIKAMTISQKSDAVSKVITSAISEGSLQAKVIFDKYKQYLTPDAQVRIGDAVQNLSTKYQARDMASQIIGMSNDAADALEKASKIENIELSDNVSSYIKQHYSQEELAQNLRDKNNREQFFNTALKKLQNGQTLCYDDIPVNLDAETKLSMMNYVNKNGQQETDDHIWETLYDMQVNDAQKFAKEDLNKYRGFLSDGEYKQFVKAQKEIQTGDYYTTIKDDDKMINEALDSMGLGKGKKNNVAYSEIKSMVREYEARKGRKISDAELQNITNSLGYEGEKGVKLYKLVERGMGEKVGFVRDVINDFSYYQKKHNGELPSDAEKFKIIQNRVNKKTQAKKSQAIQNLESRGYIGQTYINIANTVAKPHEQKVLTYFADKQVPQLAKELGLKLTVTSRYRNQKGSHHSEGMACDISMSEHSIQNRIRIYKEVLNLPNTGKVGCSDINVLAYFKGTKYERKIQDLRRYDKEHGTNHVNHVHVTLKNPVLRNAQVNNNTTRL